MKIRQIRICVVGGAGHVGLPLSLILAQKGFIVRIIDINEEAIVKMKNGSFPFLEEGGPELLEEVLKNNDLTFSADIRLTEECDVIILTVGTPVDEHLNPDLTAVFSVIDEIKPHLHEGQIIILRSTLFPGTSEKILKSLRTEGIKVGVSFCPDRIAQGKALKELSQLPQIISGSDGRTLETVRSLFSSFTSDVIELNFEEAELAKLFSNAWRYIKFATANQFYMMSIERGLDFQKIRGGMMYKYERASDFPIAGFAAGPCLFKDTMQLAAYNRQSFFLGHSSMLINETLPDFLVAQVKRKRSIVGMHVGILGMAFKANNDDIRESLAYKLRKILQYEGGIVMCTDPYVQDDNLYPLETVIASCQLIFLGCPHSVYRDIKFKDQEVVDCWGFFKE